MDWRITNTSISFNTALAVKRNFHMDDFLKSVKSTDKAIEMQQQLDQVDLK